MKLKNVFIFMVIAILVSGCTTPYQKKDFWNYTLGGYEDSTIGEGKYSLKYVGSKQTKMASIKKMWNRRAKELCGSDKYIADFVEGSDTHSQTVGYAGVPVSSTHKLPAVIGTVTCNVVQAAPDSGVLQKKELEVKVKPALDILEEKSSCIRVIIDNATKSGSVNFQELLDCASSSGVTDQDQIEDIATMLTHMGFEIAR